MSCVCVHIYKSISSSPETFIPFGSMMSACSGFLHMIFFPTYLTSLTDSLAVPFSHP